MKKIKFESREFISIAVETIISAYLMTSGVSVDQAQVIGKSLGGAIKGFSLVDSGGSVDKILSSIEKVVNVALDNDLYELTDTCRSLLRTNAFSLREIVKFMCQPDSYKLLKRQIISVCESDSGCDISTFPVDEMVSTIIEKFENEVLNNHELATYATYCMLRNKISSSEVYVANQQYVNSFEETLFLHKDKKDTCVNLKNLFVLPKYQFLRNECILEQMSENRKYNLQEMISHFIQNCETPFLFIEGDAGSGKTTLIAWMNYHYSLGDEIAMQLFDNRPVLTIRLRDLDKKALSENGSLTVAIRKYMNVSSLDELESLFPKAIMLLDGFDELCMIEGLNANHENLLYDLYRTELKGFQFIVTTRPKFISAGINIPAEFISLQHFDSEQRERWLEQYTSDKYCAQKMDDRVYTYIKNIDDDTVSCICDTPMTLYMLAAKKESAAFLENSWALYHHIFYEELSETEYNKMFPDPDRKYFHDIRVMRDVLYRVSEEIAYQMYKKRNQTFYLSDSELSSIIESLSKQIPILKHANMQEVAERSYALCCYWKANSSRGAVEFLHNNIRDFFLAEKIYREMDQIIREAKSNDTQSCQKQITGKLCSLFQYGVLETKVAEFIFLRAKYKREKDEFDFALFEYQNKLIGQIICNLSRDSIMDSGVLTEKSTLNPIQRITNILTCTIQLYRHIYEPYLEEAEKIYWVSRHPAKSSILSSLFKPVFCQVPVTISSDYMITLGSRGCFNTMDFKSCDLRNIGFEKSVITYADFSDAVLCGCDFTNANLQRSYFTSADLHYASLRGAMLDYCNMEGADLRGTELPDGFTSMDQEEQVEHMVSLGIVGLEI